MYKGISKGTKEAEFSAAMGNDKAKGDREEKDCVYSRRGRTWTE